MKLVRHFIGGGVVAPASFWGASEFHRATICNG